jgi:hypothetical protein
MLIEEPMNKKEINKASRMEIFAGFYFIKILRREKFILILSSNFCYT